MPDSSIFSSDFLQGIRPFGKGERNTFFFRRVVLFLVALVPAACLASFSPYEFLSGRIFINASLRAVHDPANPPDPGRCETTVDGLHGFPSTVPPRKKLLVVGDSTSFWNRYPGWIDRTGSEEGYRIQVYSAAQEGIANDEMRDTLAYVLDHNGRAFDAVLVRPSLSILWRIGWPDADYDHPAVGSGFSLRYSGAPVGATEVFFSHHFLATFRRRSNDLFVRRRNRWFAARIEAEKPGPGIRIPTRIPEEMRGDLEKLKHRFEASLAGFEQIGDRKGIPIVLMTTPTNRFSRQDPYVEKTRTEFPAFRKKYSLLCIFDEIADELNEVTRKFSAERGILLIDSARFLGDFPQEDLWIPHDMFHIRLAFEKPHGAFVYRELREMGF